MLTLDQRLRAANALLAPYAIPHEGILGREVSEASDETRFPFQRDRDRIIHTKAFRRLMGKTQVFVAGEGDHHRTRLTHTMEVAQISRDIARTLGCNEDLAECIALAHDLGHPPFGHAGEEALNAWMKTQGLEFEHNVQSHRIVTVLERHASAAPGLNLNREVLEGLLKHRTPHDHPQDQGHRSPTVEAQVVNLADEIAYTGHDCEDGLASGLFSIEDLSHVPLIAEAIKRAEPRGTSLRGSVINMLIMDLLTYSTSLLASAKLSQASDVFAHEGHLVAFSDDMRGKLTDLRSFLWTHLYLHPTVLAKTESGQKVIGDLCIAYAKHPPEKIRELRDLSGSTEPEAIKDYVAGMTDQFAIDQHTTLASMTK